MTVSKPKGFQKRLNEARRVNVYLDQVSIDTAKRLGNGNMSEGIRLALLPNLLRKQVDIWGDK